MSEEVFGYLDSAQMGRVSFQALVRLLLGIQMCQKPSFIAKMLNLGLKRKCSFLNFDDFYTLFKTN